ncbi:MAG: DUF4838 domain-containing protein [Phycisphaeraceae bacterium]|nr:DUF4838 domain-containing protein [Phycisphaeraceae bacterium]
MILLMVSVVMGLAGLPAAATELTTVVEDDFSANQVGVTATDGVITPRQAGEGIVWKVLGGQFSSNGAAVGNYRCVAGELNFSPKPGAAITLPFGSKIEGDAVISFKLRQADGAGGGQFFVHVTDNRQRVYQISLSPSPTYQGSPPKQSGILLYQTPTKNSYQLGQLGAHLNRDGAFQTLTLTFSPKTGFTLSSSVYPEGPILAFGNLHFSNYLTQLTLTHDGGGISWFVDDVRVQVATLTAKEAAAAQAAETARLASQAAHDRFRQARQARLPYPLWRNSLRPLPDGRPALVLADNYKAAYGILLSTQPTTQETQAAADLATWLQAICGAEFVMVREGQGELPARVISIGRTQLADAAGLPAVAFKDDGYRIAFHRDHILIDGGPRAGVLNGVYAMLEEDLGCRWYLPGDGGTAIPLQVELRLNPAPRAFLPPFDKLRRIYSIYAYGQHIWQRQNRMRFGQWAGRDVHTYDVYVPKDMFEQYPEYFALIDGKRNPHQFCPMHPEVRKLVMAGVRSKLAAAPNAEYVDVSPNDGGGACHCPLCMPIIDREGGNDMGPLLEMVNAVADDIAADYPHVRVSTLAYLNTLKPTDTFKPRVNTLLWMCSDYHDWAYNDLFIWESDLNSQAMQLWYDRWQPSMCAWIYPDHYTFDRYNLNLPTAARNLRWYASHGAEGVFFETPYPRGWAQNQQRCWIFAKLGWDPQRDTRDLLRDFNYGFYGPAAPHMQDLDEFFWNIWETWRIERVEATPRPWTKEQVRDNDLSGIINMTPEQWRQVDAYFTAARQAVIDNPAILQQVDMARLPLLYTQLERGPADPNNTKEYLAQVDEFERIVRIGNIQQIHFNAALGVPSKIVEQWRKRAAPPTDPAVNAQSQPAQEPTISK